MKRLIVLSVIAAFMPLCIQAQDDMYFVPTKELAAQTAREYGMPRNTYYIGSTRSVDEYNRRGSYVEELDSLGNDTINFDAVVGVYPDSTFLEEPTDYRYTRRMNRFDGYEPSSVYWAGFYAGRNSLWHSPWYYDSWYSPWYYTSWRYNYGYYGYYGWYDPWYDPWYYGYGWYSPWRYSYYGGWYGGWYGPHIGVVSYSSHPSGTRIHGHGTHTSAAPRGVRQGHSTRYSSGTFGGSSVRNGTFGNTRTNTSTQRTNTYAPRHNNTTPSNNGGGSFGGGSHSSGGGSFGGGGHSSGGGSRGGGGGGHFGGRR